MSNVTLFCSGLCGLERNVASDAAAATLAMPVTMCKWAVAAGQHCNDGMLSVKRLTSQLMACTRSLSIAGPTCPLLWPCKTHPACADEQANLCNTMNIGQTSNHPYLSWLSHPHGSARPDRLHKQARSLRTSKGMMWPNLNVLCRQNCEQYLTGPACNGTLTAPQLVTTGGATSKLLHSLPGAESTPVHSQRDGVEELNFSALPSVATSHLQPWPQKTLMHSACLIVISAKASGHGDRLAFETPRM